ncbi:hypothetical protein CYLTODRAFT_459634 [Cylindrobasidium torrendii FP15055 ss-10]|uniref:Uncharacterized protein n=1 Tax=Cylindrobasidium torrendii FP15055 ss-10 TaxID=1314674 RepID=A0A0D7AU47_9AGAR|nr:hypothetical protein CYLTODRAFT_459634 [Cylindrobasidium torrendii FP15055 ss-10]
MPFRRRHWMCCLPIRWGVMSLAFSGFWASLGSSIVQWLKLAYVLQHNDTGRFSSDYQATTIVQGISYALFALITLFGFIGALKKNPVLLRMYFNLLLGHLIGGVVAGSISIWRLFGQSNLEDQCRNLDDNFDPILGIDLPEYTQQQTDKCVSILRSTRLWVIIFNIVMWLLEFWSMFLVYSYRKELLEMEEVNKGTYIEVEPMIGTQGVEKQQSYYPAVAPYHPVYDPHHDTPLEGHGATH